MLPNSPGVYFVLSTNDEVLYVGRTFSLFIRWQTHHRRTQLETLPGVRIAWLSVDDPTRLSELERTYIEHFQPPLNRAPVPRIEGQKIAVTFTCSRALWEALSKLAKRDDRTMSNTVERLLRTHPRVQAAIKAQEAEIQA